MSDSRADEPEDPRCDHCDNTAQWTWHDGMWSGGAYCNEHIREKLEKDRKFPDYKDAITTEDNVTKLRGKTRIIPAGAKPLDATFPVVRTEGALDEVLGDDPELVTDGGTIAEQILEDNGVGQNEGFQGDYIGTEAAREALETFVSERVDDVVITRSRSIRNAVDVDTRIQEIGKTLGAHLDGDTPDGFLTDVEVSKWRDTDPIKWRFERVAGEADARQSRQLRKPKLVREISEATGATGARYSISEENGSSWEKSGMTLAWMRDVLEAVCETVGYEPSAVIEDDELELRDWIDELTQAGTTRVLERAAGIEDPGADSSWNRSTLRKVHDVVVAGRDPSEVGR